MIRLEPLRIDQKWSATDIALIHFPLRFLHTYAINARTELYRLFARVQARETAIAEIDDSTNLRHQIQELHACNKNLIGLQNRWRFLDDLEQSIQDFLAQFKSVHIGGVHISEINVGDGAHPQIKIDGSMVNNHELKMQDDPDFQSIDSMAAYEARFVKASSRDLSIMPRRIDNSFTTASSSASARLDIANRRPRSIISSLSKTLVQPQD